MEGEEDMEEESMTVTLRRMMQFADQSRVLALIRLLLG